LLQIFVEEMALCVGLLEGQWGNFFFRQKLKNQTKRHYIFFRWDEDSCNPDAIDCWYYADFLTDFIEEYSNSTDVGMVISGRTWSLSLLNKTEELPFICEASLKGNSKFYF
jgi:hypothetical protein